MRRAASVHYPAFFSSLFLARLADQILLFLVPLVVFQTTHRATWSGIAFFIEALPRYLVFPVCGALCDRVSPIRVLRLSQLYRALACLGGIAGYALVGGIGWLIALSAFCGVFTSQGLVAREVLLPQVFKTLRFERVLSWSQLAEQLGVVLGPMLAALLLGWMRWEFVVATTALLFLAADVATTLWQRTGTFDLHAPEAAPAHWLQPIRTALVNVVQLPGLGRLVLLASAENLVIGVTLATSAAMVTGVHQQSGAFYAGLQAAGAIATIAVLFVIARSSISRRLLGLISFAAIFAGGLIAGTSASAWVYVVGFLLVTGFDKMFNVYIRSARQKIIPPKDYGKTTGVVISLNNLTQPLAGLLVGLFSSHGRVSAVVTAIALGMGAFGGVVTVVSIYAARRARGRRANAANITSNG